MYSFSAGVALLLTVVNVTLFWLTVSKARTAADECASIRMARGRLIANEAAIETLAAQFRKLQGKFYKRQQQEREEEDVDEERDQFEAKQLGFEGIVCENWMIAKREGPNSKAATCECDYCNYQREARRHARATLLPKNHLQAVKSIESAS